MGSDSIVCLPTHLIATTEIIAPQHQPTGAMHFAYCHPTHQLKQVFFDDKTSN